MNNTITLKIQADKLIRMALEEDVSSEDVTTCAVIEPDRQARADLLCKQDGIIAGLSVFERVFQILDPEAKVEFRCEDGDTVSKGQLLAVVSGNRTCDPYGRTYSAQLFAAHERDRYLYESGRLFAGRQQYTAS